MLREKAKLNLKTNRFQMIRGKANTYLVDTDAEGTPIVASVRREYVGALCSMMNNDQGRFPLGPPAKKLAKPPKPWNEE